MQWVQTVRAYVGLILRKRTMSIPTLVATALGVADQFRSASTQIVLSPADWFALAGFCLVAAQVLVWRDERSSALPPAHQDYLRRIASTVESAVAGARPANYGTAHDRANFRSHFPGLARNLDSWDRVVGEHSTARGAATNWISRVTVFDATKPCDPRVAQLPLMEYLDRSLNNARAGAPDIPVAIEEDQTQDAVSWRAQAGANTAYILPSNRPADAVAFLTDLFQRFAHSPELAKAKTTQAARDGLVGNVQAGLRQVGQHVDLHGRCQDCRPQRKSSIYRRESRWRRRA